MPMQMVDTSHLMYCIVGMNRFRFGYNLVSQNLYSRPEGPAVSVQALN